MVQKQKQFIMEGYRNTNIIQWCYELLLGKIIGTRTFNSVMFFYCGRVHEREHPMVML